jgi:type IV secretory pathway TraG/TraD family ATPase VirD4
MMLDVSTYIQHTDRISGQQEVHVVAATTSLPTVGTIIPNSQSPQQSSSVSRTHVVDILYLLFVIEQQQLYA